MPNLLPFLADLARDALAAGFGALAGAKYAFRLERRKAAEERAEAARAAAIKLAEERATEGNLAMFALGQIHNDLVVYSRDILEPAQRSDAPWFYLPATEVTIDGAFDYRFDVRRLAFLLQSKQPGAPELLMRLSHEQDRFKTFLATVDRRARFHQEHIPSVIERLQRQHGREYVPASAELRREVGERVYSQLRNYLVDIETVVTLVLKTSKQAGEDLRKILLADLPGQVIIAFEEAETMPGTGASVLMQARIRASKRDGPAPAT